MFYWKSKHFRSYHDIRLELNRKIHVLVQSKIKVNVAHAGHFPHRVTSKPPRVFI